MDAQSFLKSKGLNSEGEYTHIPTAELALLLDEYAAQATTKIDVSKEFVNLTAKYEEGKNGK